MRLLLVEDEASAARRNERLVRDILGERIQRLTLIAQLEAAETYLRENPVDLILLDLNLNGRNGFDLLQPFVASAAEVIIVSAYRDRALEAFAYGVLDFVPKPVRKERLAQALARYGAPRSTTLYPTRLTVRSRGKLKAVNVADISYVSGADVYTELHLRDGNYELSDKTLEALDRLLPPRFVRIHKSYLVDIESAEELMVQSGGRYQLRLKNGNLLPVGRTKYKEIKEKFFS